ncbi:beta-D-xylosidase 1 [Elysia marginata]|uniref:Beta-D-xylosidase 1 n=1 Tax=Elysia marginata TaxID=1093978 RepID=A0AAV4EGI5_9GAST|nr:beta-D-xylosidase 1 [Elysia marginata]
MARGGAGPYSTPAPPIMRLGIGPYVWNSNCHRGDQGAKENATAFPQSIGLAASFSVNGVPACVNKQLMTDILRKAWKFQGYVVSDEQALEYVISTHKYMQSFEDVAAASVAAGVNLELSANMPQPVFLSIVKAVEQGKLSESLVKERIKPLFYTRMRLGQFDPPEWNPFSRLSNKDVVTPAHLAMALKVAKKSFVLLKNINRFLPLQASEFKTVAIIGPMADNYAQMFGNLPPIQSRVFAKTPLEGLKEIFPTVRYKPVCEEETKCTNYSRKAVQELVNGTDLVIAVFGTGPAVEAENNDRPNLELPGMQKKVIEEIIEHSGTAKILVVLMNAGPVNVTFLDMDSKVQAILECFFPGQATGDAIREVLINKGGNSSPAGRLPVTWPLYASQIPPMTNYSMRNRTYRFSDLSPLYPFGYGLSYSQFRYESLTSVSKVKAMENLSFEVTVKNIGDYDADEVIQCYISWVRSDLPVPVRQLGHFSRIYIKRGEEILHRATISWQRWAFWNKGLWQVKKGPMNLFCGGQQPNQTKKVPSDVLSVKFYIMNSATATDDL